MNKVPGDLRSVVYCLKIKSIQYKKLAPNSLRFIYHPSNHMKKQNKKHQNAKFIDEKLTKTKSLMFFVSFDLQDLKFGASFLY